MIRNKIWTANTIKNIPETIETKLKGHRSPDRLVLPLLWLVHPQKVVARPAPRQKA